MSSARLRLFCIVLNVFYHKPISWHAPCRHAACIVFYAHIINIHSLDIEVPKITHRFILDLPLGIYWFNFLCCTIYIYYDVITNRFMRKPDWLHGKPATLANTQSSFKGWCLFGAYNKNIHLFNRITRPVNILYEPTIHRQWNRKISKVIRECDCMAAYSGLFLFYSFYHNDEQYSGVLRCVHQNGI